MTCLCLLLPPLIFFVFQLQLAKQQSVSLLFSLHHFLMLLRMPQVPTSKIKYFKKRDWCKRIDSDWRLDKVRKVEKYLVRDIREDLSQSLNTWSTWIPTRPTRRRGWWCHDWPPLNRFDLLIDLRIMRYLSSCVTQLLSHSHSPTSFSQPWTWVVHLQ
jgi:hypothetical protein